MPVDDLARELNQRLRRIRSSDPRAADGILDQWERARDDAIDAEAWHLYIAELRRLVELARILDPQ